MEGKPKPNNSELVVRNWYSRIWTTNGLHGASLIAMITTIGVMIVASCPSPARTRRQRYSGSAAGLRWPLANFRW